MSETEIYEQYISGDKFIMVAKPHQRRTPDYPLDSLSVHFESGKYFYDFDSEVNLGWGKGFTEFFEKSLKLYKGMYFFFFIFYFLVK
jgi:8-oxo-dGTP diphosphatase